MEKSYVDISATECAKMLNLPFERLEGYAKVETMVLNLFLGSTFTNLSSNFRSETGPSLEIKSNLIPKRISGNLKAQFQRRNLQKWFSRMQKKWRKLFKLKKILSLP
jgi:hypothetical protein